MSQGNFAIVVSGGPAPGINSAIASIVIEARKQGYAVKGLQGGFSGINRNGEEALEDLFIEQVTPIAATGGSMLGTSRFNPLNDNEASRKLFSLFKKHEIDKLVVLGGEGSAYLSHQLSMREPLIRVAHIPKTIDNDLILPNKYPSFGFESARDAGTRILQNLVTEAKTTRRWFIIRTMGRKAGFLALGSGIAAGATLTLIAEQFTQQYVTPDDVAEIILSSVRRRIARGKPYGTAVIAEGIVDKFDVEQVPELKNCPRDELGRLRLSEAKVEDIIVGSLRRECRAENLPVRFNTENIGYTLRCHEPVSFDIEYTKLLGWGAVRYLVDGLGDIMVVRDFDNIAYVPLSSMVTENGAIRSRRVDLNSDIYRVASSFMIR